MKQSYFGNYYHLLVSEAGLIEWMLYTGLTLTRNSNEAPTGKTCAGFYNLSIGIERLCKLIVIIDYMANNDLTPPPKSTIKSYSHDITKLISQIIINCPLVPSNKIEICYNHKVTHKLISLLSEFGSTTRYQNINEFSSNDKTTDPLIKWQAILEEIYKEEIPERIKNDIEDEGSFYYNLVSENASFLHFDLNRKIIPPHKIFTHAKIQEKAIARATRYLVHFLLNLREALIDIGNEAQNINTSECHNTMTIPCFGDFFRGLLISSEHQLLTKKKWQNF
ncbi:MULTISPECIES: hypothetical protein [unclassified Desulfovibrio]|uniref:hypothetical protein n=1 Tax=unclassified Desulfovibrio TaxID=2593640 RepID=UPI002FD9DCB6